jgi:hypothetical protein
MLGVRTVLFPYTGESKYPWSSDKKNTMFGFGPAAAASAALDKNMRLVISRLPATSPMEAPNRMRVLARNDLAWRMQRNPFVHAGAQILD